jgi:type VI secretion system Hcp family effector
MARASGRSSERPDDARSPGNSIMQGYIKVGDFDGDSSDASHQGWSVLLSLSAHLSHAVGPYAHGDSKAKVAVAVGDIGVVKQLDSASVKIQRALVNREPIAKVEIHLCGISPNGHEPFLAYELSEVFVTSYTFTPQIDAFSSMPSESLSFAFKKIKWTFSKMSGDGKKQGKVTHEHRVGEFK